MGTTFAGTATWRVLVFATRAHARSKRSREDAEREDRLAAVMAPVHARPLDPLGRERLAHSIGDTEPIGQSFGRHSA